MSKYALSRVKKDDGTIISKYGSNFLLEFPQDEFHAPILHLQGKPYEIGYARSILSAHLFQDLLHLELSPMYAIVGGWNPLVRGLPTLEHMEAGRERLFALASKNILPAIEKQAPEYLEELKGVHAAYEDMGIPLTWEDIINVHCDPEGMLTAGACSNFAAWGKATLNGKLIRGDNLDLRHFGNMHKGVGVSVVKPHEGYSYIQVGLLATITGSTYLNEEGLNYGENTSPSDNVNWPQIPHLMHAKKIAQYAKNIEESYDILKKTGGTTGWNNLICETNSSYPHAVVIENTGKEIAIREEDPELLNVIWSTNFFNCYPGWQGYEGPNLIPGQIEYLSRHLDYLKIQDIDDSPLSWEDVNTLEKWKKRFQCPRYNQYRKLLKENYGRIDVNKAIEIQSDPEFTTKRTSPLLQLTPIVPMLFGRKGAIHYQALFSVYSAIIVPEDKDIWVANGAEYAQKATWWKINLDAQLKLMEKLDD